ncbi:anti-anti-sigma factor [Amycolatopsis mediterranei S699]|uniref:Anti-sigma factor antagonist n=2 Tax=Amycolatopsis mediterranei TaxID=33910 RepID=A0A0H3D409_AMYMU|nr:STAS domain-containing protein [Amycolatopsis mediterranei]ADJ45391.1 anti-anti-sigma factor [Amycolatopsis mediterranei U32]AEK42154.1 anti-anti-sigma factor [Amycolatopsis mediterranei S699]AFO77102.1 anti-anti-sigma factor [Amycolatopsis mediterranei S699]AGT84230.1 anti-anti-sigma factor [Amycolatopsis mediterranei RB]KDO05968.1 anti-anti-sigma factor [Amycolatopsis mediterranei]
MPGTATISDIDAVHCARTNIAVTTTADASTVTVTGHLDLATTPRLRDQLDDALKSRPLALIIDLDAVGFCSSGGLSALLEAVTNAHARGIPCAIITTQRAVIRPIKLLQLDRVLPLHAGRTEAETWLALAARLR